MRKSRFKEAEIVWVLKEVEGGRQMKEVCCENGVSDAIYYNWKSMYAGKVPLELQARLSRVFPA